ncbi:non-ribosomal peptide synthetase [Pseudomonas fontis]|uniref:Amino acid adenylation domain-containing protein n=1 Tax=Pseudomonas fontis TaxID=2942633 RepID=A0ABT5NY48_9PSED|nr:amino acid adenylation domain-containing protein [Pseudomonas fontis]MDD0972512.1 amino acid adenylation domain-containing protein [Pseudomonas fontis]MDD0993036.1 amino acid adenylation domain-containing protein [Pseudomonas fontis]
MNSAEQDPQRQSRLEQALLERRKGATGSTLPSGAPPALSAAQQRLWLHQSLEALGGLYNMPCALRLRGAVDVEALRHAIEHLVQRHAVLRTVIEEQAGQPRARCCETPRIDLPVLEMADEAQAHDWLRGEANAPLDLSKAPLLRAHLLRLDSRHHLLSLTVHHIACDGWSMGVILREIGQAYEAFSQGLPSPLPALKAHYADYAQWQQQWLSEARLDTQLTFWKQQLKDAPALLSLPLEQPRPARQSYAGKTLRFALDADLNNRLRSFCRSRGVTPYMLLLAVFNVLLSRYSASEDIVVGSPVANRFPQETEALVGFFVNTLVMRNQPRAALSFEAFLQQVKQQALAAYAHQDVPFDRVVHALQPERSASHSPLFQVEFVLQQGLPQRFALGKASVEPLPRESSYTKFDLTLALEDAAEQINGQIEYNSELFSEGFAQRMAGHLRCLLASALASPECALGTLSLLPEEEQATLRRWGAPSHDPLPDKHLLTYLADTVAARPDATALEHGRQRLSYLELDRLSNRIAHALKAANVGRGARVALYMARGSLYLASMLATFKLGALFVPFDPQQRAERTTRMLEHSLPALILADPPAAEALAQLPLSAAYLQLDNHYLASFADTWTDSHAGRLDDTAYMIFTSGSTGEPKAAMVSHRGMLNHLLAKAADLQLSSTDCIAQIAVQTFDVAVWQFFVALLVGARTRVITGTEAWEPSQLLTQLQDNGVSIVETVPSHLELLLDELAAQPQRYPLPGLRWMISNGEPLATALATRWFAACPDIHLMNAYGPSECSDDVTHLCLKAAPASTQPYLSIGQPIGNARIHVLDAQLQRVPIGVTGEIHIGGLCVGQGYFHDPQRSAERFIDDPFDSRPGARLYKTGDLGRYLADGSLQMLGRCDFQLKIRGCRIEAGEVEAVLRTHPAVEQALVLGDKDASEQAQLVAYVIAPQRPAPSATSLRTYCRQHLPDYMVPAAICLLDSFPLLANGKVDRGALPPMASFDLGSDVPYRAPRNALETRLAAIWAPLLGVERIGIDDSFFQLGGHSLLAVELTSLCRDVLGPQLNVAQLFEYPTIAELVECCCATQQEAI